MLTNLTRDHLIGFFGGVGMTVLGYYLYKRNKSSVDEFLRSQGIHVPAGDGGASLSMSLEDLVREKERLEDLIAEKELACKTEAPVS